MGYLKGIGIGTKYPKHNRRVDLGVYDTLIPESGHLSDLDLDSVIEIIADLKNVVNSKNPEDYLHWGVDLFLVLSSPTTSTCENDLQGIELGSYPTVSLLNLMIQIKEFKEFYQIPENLKVIIGQAFIAIKNNPDVYLRYKSNDVFYWIDIDGVKITLTLVPGDFNLSETEYVSELSTNF